MPEPVTPDTEEQQPWLDAIDEATACLRHRRTKDAATLDKCLVYLVSLEQILDKPTRKWDQPPRRPPPPLWEEATAAATTPLEEQMYIGGNINIPATVVTPVPNLNNFRAYSNNPFDVFQHETDDDNDSSIDDRSENSSTNEILHTLGEYDAEAGDQPVWNNNSAPSSSTTSMDALRLFLRILTSQSEVYAAKATLLRQNKHWRQGAELYSFSLNKIHQAVIVADGRISGWFAEQEIRNNGNVMIANHHQQQRRQQEKPRQLMQDANIVEVAIETLTVERDKYLAAVERQERYLVRKLAPQWKSRDEVKKRMGERWYHNPSPKMDFAKLREDLEEELSEIRGAMTHLQSIDTTMAKQTTQTWKLQLSASITQEDNSLNE